MSKKKSIKNLFSNARTLPGILTISIFILVVGTIFIRQIYVSNLKPLSSSATTSYFTVSSGDGVDVIAKHLQTANLIKSSSAFKNYVRTNELNNKLQAGTYVLSPSLNVPQIVKKMVNGDVAKDLLTILPGNTLAEVKASFSKAGYTEAQIKTAFSPSTYLGNPILNYLPKGATLEGMLYPDSFQKTSDTPADAIVKQSLDEMVKHLTPDIISSFANHNLNPYQGITLASIVYQETGDANSMPTVAQVFLSRLAQSINLESNVTANYAADLAGVARNVSITSPYNTYLISGLPPGPISNVNDSALKAVAHPDTTDYLYFIAGDDGKIHFTRTKAEHDQAIRQYCTKLCAQP